MPSTTVSGKVWIGSGGQSVDNTVYNVQDSTITLPGSVTTATATANVNASGYLKNFSGSQKNITVYLCDENGSNAVNIFSRAIGGGNTVTDDTSSKSVNLDYTAVVSGNKILATDRSQTGTSTTAGNVMTDSHFTAGTKIQASTFNSQVLGL